MKDTELKALLDAYAISYKKWDNGRFNDLNRIVSRHESKLDMFNGRLGITTSCIGARILYEMSPSNILILKPIKHVPQTQRVYFPDLDVTLCKEQRQDEADFSVVSQLLREDIRAVVVPSQCKKAEKERRQKESTVYPGLVEIYNVQIYETYLSGHFYDTLSLRDELYLKWQSYDPVLK